MDNITLSPTTLSIIIAVVGVTAWIVGRLNGKVDWKVFHNFKEGAFEEVKKELSEIKTTLAIVSTKVKSIETHLNNRGKKHESTT